MTQLALLNPENVSDAEVSRYRLRNAARAVVFDEDSRVALLCVAKDNYYKLPGGGLEGDEDFPTALRRECLEEIGCEIEIVRELGSILEYRKFEALRQFSQCYLAKVRGEKGGPNFTEKELEEGFSLVWLSYDQALTKLSEQRAASLEGSSYITPRDLIFLQAAQTTQ